MSSRFSEDLVSRINQYTSEKTGGVVFTLPDASTALTFEVLTYQRDQPNQARFGTWNESDDEKASVRIIGTIYNAKVGPYGEEDGIDPSWWNVKKLSQLKMSLLLRMPDDAPKDIQILWEDQCTNLLKLQEGIKTGHGGEFTRWGFVRSYRTDDGEWRMETLVKWSVFERRKNAAGPDPATLLSGTHVETCINTLANTPLRDPSNIFASIKLTPSERWGYIYRDDVGAYNLDGSVVEFGDLRSIFVRDTVVGLDVNLAYMRADEMKDVFSLAMHSMQVIGPLDIPLVSRPSTPPPSTSSPSKRKRSTSAYQPSPKKPATIFTKAAKKDEEIEEIEYDVISSRTLSTSGSPVPPSMPVDEKNDVFTSNN